MGRGGSGGRGHGGFGGGHGRGRGAHGMGYGSGGNCICPDCGKTIPHTPGFPCSEEICPACGAMMVRDTGQKFGTGKQGQEEKEVKNQKKSKKDSLFPVVDVNLCTGCGICIEKCPFDSIVMKDGKAFIQNDTCRRCMICVKVCPENAIVL